jgi:hypothetical protein
METPEREADERGDDRSEEAGYDPAKDADAGPPATEQTVDQDAERDQAEG